MAGSWMPREDVEQLVLRALEVGRFAGRWSKNWIRPDGLGPWPMGVKARATLTVG